MLKREITEYIVSLINESGRLNELVKELNGKHTKYSMNIVGKFAVVTVTKESEE